MVAKSAPPVTPAVSHFGALGLPQDVPKTQPRPNPEVLSILEAILIDFGTSLVDS